MSQLSNTQFATLRAALAVTAETIAEAIGVTKRTVQRWESGASPVPADAAELAGLWADRTATLEQLALVVARADDDAGRRPVLATYRDAATFAADPSLPTWAPSYTWHRAAIGRVFAQLAREGIDAEVRYI